MTWRAIPGMPGYEVSDTGEVRSGKRGAWRLLSRWDNHGYLVVSMSNEGVQMSRKVHRLVLLAFVGPCPEGQEVRHLDGDRANNNLTNLAYGTRSENMRDVVAHGTHRNGRGESAVCRRGHAYDTDNTHYTREGWRQCRACDRDRARAAYRLKNGLAA